MVGFHSLGIKVVYKLIAFVGLPYWRWKKQKNGKVEDFKGRSQTKKNKFGKFVTKIFDERDDDDDKLFTLKFFILQVFDFSSNIAIFTLVLVNNVIISNAMGYSHIKFESDFIKKISLWTSVTFFLIFKG